MGIDLRIFLAYSYEPKNMMPVTDNIGTLT